MFFFEYKIKITLDVDKLNKLDKIISLLLSHQNVHYRVYENPSDIDIFLNMEGLLTTDEVYNRQLYQLHVNNAEHLKLLESLNVLYLLKLTKFDSQKDNLQLSSNIFSVSVYNVEQSNPAYMVFFDKQVENSIKLIDYND